MSMQQDVTLEHDGSFHFPLCPFQITVSSWRDWWAGPLLLLPTMKDPVMADKVFVDSSMNFSCYVSNLSQG